MSNLSGPLSRIEPLSSVPVVTKACPLRCHLVDRSEAQCKSHDSEVPKDPVAFLRGLKVRSFRFVWPDDRTSPASRANPVGRLVSCISLRITRVILVDWPLAPCGASRPVWLASVYNWCAEPYADSERIASSYSKTCMA